MADERKPWEKQEQESAEAYARFLVYLNLGITRTVESAYFFALSTAGNSGKSRVPKKVPKRSSGQWDKDSVQYQWKERASAWDISVLTMVGQQVVTKYVNALDLSFQRIIEALSNAKVKPRSWKVIIESITTLGSFIPQETVATIRQNNAGDSVPAIGASAPATGDAKS